MINKTYADYAWEQTAALLAIDSPSGFTANAARWVRDAFEALGFAAEITTKGGVLIGQVFGAGHGVHGTGGAAQQHREHHNDHHKPEKYLFHGAASLSKHPNK